jgi:hypothetical protein
VAKPLTQPDSIRPVVSFASLDDFTEMKQTAGCPKDNEDLKFLRRLQPPAREIASLCLPGRGTLMAWHDGQVAVAGASLPMV